MKILCTLIILCTINGCGKPTDSESTAINTSEGWLTPWFIAERFSTNIDCEYSGYLIKSGYDYNRDYLVQDSEIDKTEVLCLDGNDGNDGVNGFSSIVNYIRDNSIPECDYNSGLLVVSGLDLNRDFKLQEREWVTVNYLCDGE